MILADYLVYCLDDHLLHPFPLSTDCSPQGREGTLKSHVPESPGCFLPDPPVFITQCRNNRIDRGLVSIPGKHFDRLPSGGGIGIADETDKMPMLLSLPGFFLLIHTVERADKEKKDTEKDGFFLAVLEGTWCNCSTGLITESFPDPMFAGHLGI